MKKLRKIKGERIFLKLEEKLPPDDKKHYVETHYFGIMLRGKRARRIGSISAKLGMNEFLYYVGNIGYNIDEPFRGNGYACEAVELIKQLFRKNGFTKVIITNDPRNYASIRVCEKLGAKFIKTVDVPEGHILLSQGHEQENIWELEI